MRARPEGAPQATTHSTNSTNTTSSNAAVDGFFGGLAAGLAMAAYLGVAALIRSEGLGTMFMRFTLTEDGTPLTGLLVHLAVAGVYGIIFGLLVQVRPSTHRLYRMIWLLGLLYGAALWAAGRWLILPVASPGFLQIGVHWAVAHLMYGGALGLAIQRLRRVPNAVRTPVQ